jgi:hypothetical protein
MKTLILALTLILSTAAHAKTTVPEVFALGRDLCMSTARAQLIDACDFHAEVKTRKASLWGMAVEICSTYGESNPAREGLCFARAVNLIKDDDTKVQATKCVSLATPGEKSSCIKKVFIAKK